MSYARVFKSGNSQAVRLPKEFRFDVEQVEIFRRGEEVVLREHSVNATSIFNAYVPLGALRAARFQKVNPAGMYDMQDVLGLK